MCSLPRLTVAKQHISSAFLEGPYWNNVNYPPLPSVTEVKGAALIYSIVCDKLLFLGFFL
jgi:hypothetical protein